MKIRNDNVTQTSFQMAFRMPKGEDLKAFEKIVFNPYKCSDNVMRKGLDNFIKEQSKNTRFDVQFKNGNFEVLDTKSFDKIIESYEERTYHPNRSDRSFAHYAKRLDETRDSDIKHGFTSLAAIISMIKESFIETFLRPQENLPSGLRKAGERASLLEKIYLMKSPMVD
ncbi:MAG: hypothetical protein E7Z87_08730 [Cyanobacteria bacterium SIG26]|nr:hypothetical protein [Cyanobacteria bacterium SIG26]